MDQNKDILKNNLSMIIFHDRENIAKNKVGKKIISIRKESLKKNKSRSAYSFAINEIKIKKMCTLDMCHRQLKIGLQMISYASQLLKISDCFRLHLIFIII